MDVIMWRDDNGRVVVLTPPAGLTPDEAIKGRPAVPYKEGADDEPEQAAVEGFGPVVPQDRPVFVVDNATLPDAPISTWRLSDDGKVTTVPDPLAYKHRRAAEYPPVGDQLDAILKGGAELDALKAKIAAIKAKHPKPEGGGK